MKKLFLYGPPAGGKTYTSKALARKQALKLVDLDAEIERLAGMAVKDIFAAETEAGFRRRELETLKMLAAGDSDLISLGGGALLNPEAKAVALASGRVICRTADPETLWARVQQQAGTRPLARSRESLMALLEKRGPHYAEFPQATEIGGRFVIDSGDVESEVVVGAGMLASIANWIGPYHRKLVVADSNTAPLYGEKVAAALGARLCVIPAGEEHKTISTVCEIWKACLEAGITRKDVLIAVGGGVVGDLTGFAAATWMRGVDWINIPTTLLSVVDSSVGGKTGADLPEGKNLIGAFHSPRLVLADVDTLATLPPEQVRNGMAEAIKHFIIAGKDPSGLPIGNGTCGKLTSDFVAETVKVKVDVVTRDPYEKTGERAKLNLGHTVGHAVEIASDFSVLHGEGVAIGSVEEARIAERMGLANPGYAEEVAKLFAAAGLPTEMPTGMTLESLKPIMAHDKKNSGGEIRVSLPYAHGDVRLTAVKL